MDFAAATVTGFQARSVAAFVMRHGKKWYNKGKLAWLGAILVILLAILGGAALFYLLFILPTRWLKIERIRHPLGLRQTILQISDMHVERLRIKPGQLAAVIAREKPDYLFLTGDYTMKPGQIPRLGPYFAIFRDSGIPVFAVLGNHDYQQPKVRRLITFIESFGIRVLRNEAVALPGFRLIGIDDCCSGKSNIAQSFRFVDTDPPAKKVVITHDPNLVLQLHRPFDYLMAGHFHGKQLNVPFFYRFRPMGPLPAMGIYKGLHRTDYGTYYISKGIGQTGVNLRFLVRSEVTVHEL